MAGTSTGGGASPEDDASDGNRRGRDPGEHELPDATVAARFADIVAQFEGPQSAPPADTAPPVTPDPGAPRPIARTPGPRDWPASADVEALEDAQSHFTPPDPGPVVTGRDPLVTLAWAATVGIPVLTVVGLILRTTVAGLTLPVWTGPVAVVAFLASVAVLVWRMPSRREPDDHDDGAVV